MRTVPRDPDRAAATADRRRLGLILLAAALLPASLMLIGGTSHPEWGFVLIALVFPALWIARVVRNRRSREGTDERARDIQRRAANFSWQVTALALTGVMAWTGARHGIRAVEPYLFIACTLLASYVGATLWLRWRDV
jgi:hypothetical protein